MKQYQTNQMSLSRIICQKPDFGPILGLNGPKFWPKFCGQYKKPPLIVKYHWNQSECAISDKSNESESRYLLKTRFWTKFGPKMA